jgi:hypothetical protein
MNPPPSLPDAEEAKAHEEAGAIPKPSPPPSIVPGDVVEQLVTLMNASAKERQKRSKDDNVKLALWILFVFGSMILQIIAAMKGIHLVVPQ